MTTTRTWLARGRGLAASAYRRTVGEVVQRRRSRAYVAREHAAGRTVTPLAPRTVSTGRDITARDPQRTRTTRGRSTR